jgi:hypothetical protein
MSSSKVSEMESLNKRLEDLTRAKIRAETEEAHLSEERKKLIGKISSEYGVSTLDELRDLSKKLIEQNTVNMKKFEVDIAKIEQDLVSIQSGKE